MVADSETAVPQRALPAAGTAKQLCRPRRGEGGFSFVEIIVAVAIMGIAIVALVTALLDSVGASTVHQQRAVGDTVFRNYVEAIKAAVQQNCSAVPPNGSYASAPHSPRSCRPRMSPATPIKRRYPLSAAQRSARAHRRRSCRSSR